MSQILLIETATTVCSVALATDGIIVGCKQVDQRNVHAEVITKYIEELINTAGLKYTDLDAIAISCGPGSYTGLRIGVSTAKGLCYALDRPLIAIETLAAMANGVITDKGLNIADDTLLCPMIDARRMEVYTAVFNGVGNKLKGTAAEIIDEQSFSDYLADHKILFFGDGAEKCLAVLGNNPNAQFLNGFTNSATHLAKQAAEKFAARDFEDVAYFEPFYLKEFLITSKKS
ncbi:MAG: tRNA (adenosine(37)-N6)-threonylcarbamoyltransferase complex dimerization subunit type 1 TsaB [Sphingobacteriaceae bacterium]|nr:MAG: tRNA (adenosine(37)-N6)-threonylcarbamoyltransferase complex dimerization subunit type 1 TsaB [Sphingobacteriaceae bacterium]